MDWLAVLDPLEGLKPETDTTLAVIQQARSVGIRFDVVTIDKLSYHNDVFGLVTDADGREHKRVLKDYDLIFMRKEPPYDLAFHYATQLLSLAETLVVNNGAALRDYNEKLIALVFDEFMPPTLVSSQPGVIQEFLEEYDGGVIKSLDSFQGKSVRKIGPSEIDLIEEYTQSGRQPVMVQQFLEQVYEGDKRVMLLGDKLLGAALRRPKQGYHANFANSEALSSPLTPREQEIIAALGPWLVQRGIYLTGLDLIGETLTEINITCPTGIQQIGRLDGKNLAAEIVEYFRELAETCRGEPHVRP